MAGNHTLATPVVAPRPRHRMAKSLESESASIAVILGGFAVVAASVLASGLPLQTPTAEAASAIVAVQSIDARYQALGGPAGELGVPPNDESYAEPAAPVRRSQWWWIPAGVAVAAAVALPLRRLTRRPVDAPAPETPSLRPAAAVGR